MDHLGLLCIGAFVGALATFGLKFVTHAAEWKQMLTTVIAAVFAGAVLLFIDKFKSSNALGAYGVGLLLSLMWAYANVALDNIKSSNPSLKLLGWLHMAAVTIISIVAAALVLPPAFRDAWK